MKVNCFGGSHKEPVVIFRDENEQNTK